MRKKSVIILLCAVLVVTCLPLNGFAGTKEIGKSKEKNSIENRKEKGHDERTLDVSSSEKNLALKKKVNRKGVQARGYEADLDEKYVRINLRNNFTVYRGQRVWLDFTMWDTWEDYYTIPSVDVYDSKISRTFYSLTSGDPDFIVEEDDFTDYSGYLPVNLKNGSYVLAVSAMPCDVYGQWPSDVYDSFDIPINFVQFKVKDLPKPTKLSVSKGKRKCTIKFKKSSAATKCMIYRSTKKSSGYKKVATVSGTKYTDKKVKKGKRYYYKVKALRGSNGKSGTAYSAYTVPKRSGKVK